MKVLVAVTLLVGLERFTRRPFLATLSGFALAHFLRATPLPHEDLPHENLPHEDYRLFEVYALPAIGFRAVGQTWGEVVLVLKGRATPDLLAHEACHVSQFRRLTSLGLWGRYALEWMYGLLKHRDLYRAYAGISLEVEARHAAVRYNRRNDRRYGEGVMGNVKEPGVRRE